MNGMDELIRLQTSMMTTGGGENNGNNHDNATSAGAFINLMMNPTLPSGGATNFNNAQVGKTTTTSPMSGSQTIMPQSAANNVHGTLMNSRVFEVKTGEPTSNLIQTSNYQLHHDNGENHSDHLTRSSSEPMLTGMLPVMQSIAGLAGNRAEPRANDNSSNNIMEDPLALQRRNSEPAPNMFEDTIFDQLYNEGSALNGGRDDIFADGFHSPPLGSSSPVATKRPSPTPAEQPRPRANSEPPNWDLFDTPSPIPLEEKSAHLRPHPSQHILDTTTVTVATKTGEDDDPSKLAFNLHPHDSGRSRQHRRDAPFKRSRSADPLLIQAFTTDYASHPSDGHKTSDCADIFRYLNPEGELDLHSGEKIKRRRSEPLPGEDILAQLDRSRDEYSHDRTGSLTSSFSSGDLPEIENVVETGKNRQTSDMMQLILGMKKDSVQGDSNNMPLMHAIDSVGTHPGNAAVAQVTNALPSHGLSQSTGRYLPASTHQTAPMSTQQTNHLSNIGNAMNFNPLYTDPPMQQNTPMQQNINMSYATSNTVPSANGGPQMMSVQQPPVNFLNPNIPSVASNENDLSNILDAVTETHNNLQILQSAVARCQDPKAVDSITRAFELTAACSQFVLLSQYDTAHNLLNQAWAHIKIVESRLSVSGMPSGMPASNFPAGFGQNQNEFPLMSSIDKPLCLPQKSKKKKVVKAPKPKAPKLEELPPQSKDDPLIIMTRLNALMERTITSQKNLQKYDKQNGLPRSHAQTMISTSRSRKQLQKGIVLSKRDGKPLIHSSSASQQKKGESTTQTEATGSTRLEQSPVEQSWSQKL